MIENYEVAIMFNRIADLLEIKGELVFKVNAYRRVAESLMVLPENLRELMKKGTLKDVPGVGEAIYRKLEEIITTGNLRFLNDLENEVPPTLIDLLQVPDVGSKTVALLWKQAGITTIDDLEIAARAGKLEGLPGIGKKTEQRILEGIEALKRRSKRLMLPAAWKIANQWMDFIRDLPGIEIVEAAGSLRRWKMTIGDIDMAAASTQPDAVMEAFCTHPDVKRVLSKGTYKSSVEIAGGVNIQLWLQPPENFGSLLQHTTGSKDHNIRLRGLAQEQGLSLSELGVSEESGKVSHFAGEEELYAFLGLDWIPPELREDRGEVDAAREHRLPGLLKVEDLKADLHIHSNWSDGAHSIEEIALAARERGLKVIAITDHSGGVGATGSLTAERLKKQRIEIDAVQESMGTSLRVLHGVEVEILSDGSLDYPDEVLAGLEIVVASMHYDLRQPRAEITARLVKAMHSPHVDIIAHPTGRLYPDVESADLDWENVLETAYETNTILEINSNPNRLDLDEIISRRAVEAGVLLAINTDSHRPAHLERTVYGVSVARRAWLSPRDFISTWDTDKIVRWFETGKDRREALKEK
ncbi:MAG: DNA polymerase/3'-5' exonuclease PolX [Anaerolineaceae bacterium]